MSKWEHFLQLYKLIQIVCLEHNFKIKQNQEFLSSDYQIWWNFDKLDESRPCLNGVASRRVLTTNTINSSVTKPNSIVSKKKRLVHNFFWK